MENKKKQQQHLLWVIIGLSGLTLLVLIAFFSSKDLQWRVYSAAEYLKGMIEPVGTLAPAHETTQVAKGGIFAPFADDTHANEDYAIKSAAALPLHMQLTPPEFVKERDIQGWNNCGPATLALALRMYRWKGDQGTIAAVIKPEDLDKNVNIEELSAYVGETTGLKALVRVGGDLNRLENLLAAGYPVIVEEAFKLKQSFWPGDDRWSSHFVLVTGYDRDAGNLTTQDAYYGPDVEVDAQKLLADWQAFNYVYLVVYKPEQETALAALLGEDWSETTAFTGAVETALTQTRQDPHSLYAWFNLGSSLLALQQNEKAWQAFNEARKLGLPQRMLRYQFGPFEAAYATGRMQDLKDLLTYALKTTSNSEEALYWQGKLLQWEKQPAFARRAYLDALAAHPNYLPALQGLKSLQ